MNESQLRNPNLRATRFLSYIQRINIAVVDRVLQSIEQKSVTLGSHIMLIGAYLIFRILKLDYLRFNISGIRSLESLDNNCEVSQDYLK